MTELFAHIRRLTGLTRAEQDTGLLTAKGAQCPSRGEHSKLLQSAILVGIYSMIIAINELRVKVKATQRVIDTRESDKNVHRRPEKMWKREGAQNRQDY